MGHYFRMRTKAAVLALVLASTAAIGQTAEQRELCRVFAGMQRSMAELRDQGVSLATAQAFQRKEIMKYPTLVPALPGLLEATKTTYGMKLSPDSTEVVAYAICLDTLK